MSAEPLGQVAVLGLGVVGGSLCRAIQRLGLASRVTGWSATSADRDAALTADAIDLGASTWAAAVRGADVVIVATPPDMARELLSQLTDAMPARAVVTDLVGMKQPMQDAATRAGLRHRWVGSHPMAGSPTSGFWASRADLFEGATVWLTGDNADPTHVERITDMWRRVGGRPATISVTEHDRMMQWVSHLPRLVSNVLAETLHRHGIARTQLGPVGRHATDVARGAPEWTVPLMAATAGDLPRALRDVGERALELADALEAGDLESVDRLFRETRRWSDRA